MQALFGECWRVLSAAVAVRGNKGYIGLADCLTIENRENSDAPRFKHPA